MKTIRIFGMQSGIWVILLKLNLTKTKLSFDYG